MELNGFQGSNPRARIGSAPRAVLRKPPPHRTNVRQWGRGEARPFFHDADGRFPVFFFCAFSVRPAFGNRIYDPLIFVRLEFDPLTLFWLTLTWLTLTWLTLVGLTLTR